VTYPNAEVARLLNAEFIPVRINTQDQPKVARRFHLMWSPILVALDHRGFPLHRIVGYIPPSEMLAQLHFIRALNEMRSARPANALQIFRQLYNDFPRADVVPEAIYWEGIAAYRQSKNKEDLWVVWRQLAAKYPNSLWAARTTLLPEADTSLGN
jgi:TolA-binding protein